MILLILFVNELDIVPIIDEANVNKVSLSHEIDVKSTTADRPELIFLFALCDKNKVRLHLSNDSTNRRKKWRDDLLIPISRIDRFACFTHY